MRWRKAWLFWPVALGLILADCGTKRIAEAELEIGEVQSVMGEAVRVTLAYNPGAAFGIEVGDSSRVIFSVLATATLLVLGWMARGTEPGQKRQLLALALIWGGAAGNLLDRLRSARGVVDFIDVGVGGSRFWTFNIADVGVTTGAVLLLWSLWGDGRGSPVGDEPEGAVLER